MPALHMGIKSGWPEGLESPGGLGGPGGADIMLEPTSVVLKRSRSAFNALSLDIHQPKDHIFQCRGA